MRTRQAKASQLSFSPLMFVLVEGMVVWVLELV
jgi:hypothetical protein